MTANSYCVSFEIPGGSCGGSHRAILRHLTIRGRNQLTKHGHDGIAVVTVVIEPVKETNIVNVNNKPLLGYLGPIGSVVPGENSHEFSFVWRPPQ